MISKEYIQDQIKKSGNLPTLPEILMKLLDACDNDGTSLADIASIISKDPALSFRVLHLVNSAYYGLRSAFTGVEQAVAYLGINSVKNIAITASIHQVFDRKRLMAVKQFNFSTFWWHSLMCATLARRIAKKTGFASHDEAYLSGLLHDIGRLILISTFPKQYETFRILSDDVQSELKSERQFIGLTHSEAGAWLVLNWKLNSLMADAVRYHHEPLEQVQEAFPLVKIVYLASLLIENDQNVEHTREAGILLFNLDSADIAAILDGANEEVSGIAESMGINAIPPSAEKSRQEKGAGHGGIAIKFVAGDRREAGLPLTNSDGQDLSMGGQADLTARVKSFSLLSGFLENLVQAGDSEAIIAVFEQSMKILFDIEKVLFFLPDKDYVLLKGQTSCSSSLLHLSQGLALPAQQSSSLIAKAYRTSSLLYLTAEDKRINLADEQVFTAFGSTLVLLVPIVADKKPQGVVLLGLPESVKTLPTSDYKLIQMIAQQVGLCLFLERMKARRAEEIESERMAAVSLTARKFAHEINNPLGIITNYLTTIRLKLKAENKVLDEIGVIEEEISRISSMIKQMDKFSQTTLTKLELTDVNAVIENIIHVVKAPLFAAARTVVTFLPDHRIPQISSSGDALKQVIMNLIKNASEAMADGGRVLVKTKIKAKVADVGRPVEPDEIEILVEDNGPGLPESVVKDLYKPFVTTKRDGHSGLGLSIVHKTVKDLGGSILYTSKPGEGTIFSIHLPIGKNSKNKDRLTD
jgi:HD-like signal output (HDOD) protein/nitrogen-specific signal transduction histidine kinase